MEFKKGISVVICCYNSATKISHTLAHLAAQKANTLSWEIVVVNNASKDNTRDVAVKAWHDLNSDVTFTIVDQDIPGLSAARDKGIATASYEYILFCDDDNWLQEDFLQRAFNCMEQNPAIGILGGQSEAAADILIPEWFSNKSLVFAVGKQAAKSGLLRGVNQNLYGACMVVRRSGLQVLDNCGFSFLNSGRFGDKLTGGEDIELGKAFRLANYQLYYDESLKFKHYMPADRINWPYFLRLGKGSASSGIPIFIYDQFLRKGSITKREFRVTYWKYVGVVGLKIAKRPFTFLKYIKGNAKEGDLAYFEMMRLVETWNVFSTRYTFAEYCFEQIKKFKEKVYKLR
ncbi:glycosyltransferase family 2 protein [Rufibacter ruber]|uniref:glycosyltransferase family 2 protein n=1 Tax=Rufibacter ruber TaxID=1783499 RepID=UPI0008373A63|nr:glycosyltransferase [Rufibacter ruber]